MTWHCLGSGLPGSTCPATGTSQASATKHADSEQHVTITHQATWRREEEA